MIRTSAALRLPPGAAHPTDGGSVVRVRAWRGEGSYARVYRADLAGRVCAMKVAKGEVPEAADRLGREREVLDRLHHPQVVALLDAGAADGAPFLVLEWLDGETLADVVAAKRRLPLRQSLEILRAASDGVAAIHAAGCVHGDIRPQNLILAGGRGGVLTDPGPQPRLQSTGSATPEEDIRALGALLHFMLTGEQPAGAGRMVPGAGYNAGAVRLWDGTRAVDPPSAPELLAQVRALQQAL